MSTIKQDVINEIMELANELCYVDWDGYGSDQVHSDSVKNAINFINSLPDDISYPSIGAEPSGDITLEWYKNERLLISLTISKDNKIIYAGSIYGYKYISDHKVHDIFSFIRLNFEKET